MSDDSQQQDAQASSSHKQPQGPGLLRSSALVGCMTMLSRVLGLVRDIVIANSFGAGAAADAFFVAFKIPNFLRRLFAEGAFAQAFVPVLSEYRTQRGHDAVKTLVDRVSGSLGLVLMLLTLVAVMAAPVLAMVFAPGFYMADNPLKFDLTVDMLRITFPYLFLISMTAFAGSILNSYDRFLIPAFTPVLLNISLISAVIWLQPLMTTPVMALAWGVMIAGCAQLVLQLPFLSRIGLLPTPRPSFKDEGVRKIIRLMLPAIFGVSVSQINLLLDTILASLLQTGSVSWLYYSDRLVELPLGVFGIAIATVVLPSLSRQHAKESSANFAETLDWSVRMVLLIGLPAAVALLLLAEPLIVTLFQYGELDAHDVVKTALSLQAYSMGLLAFMLIKVLATGFFSRQDTKTPVKIGIIAMVANMVFNLALIVPLQHVGLALATSLSAFMNAGLLLRGLIKEGVFQWQPGWLKFGLQMGFANGLMVAFVLYLNPVTELWLSWDVWAWAGQMAIICAGGVLVYFVALFVGGLRLSDLRH